MLSALSAHACVELRAKDRLKVDAVTAHGKSPISLSLAIEQAPCIVLL